MSRGKFRSTLQASVLLLVGCCTLLAPRFTEAAVEPYWIVGGSTLNTVSIDVLTASSAVIAIGNEDLAVDTDFGYPAVSGPMPQPTGGWTVNFAGVAAAFSSTSSPYLVNSLAQFTDTLGTPYYFDAQAASVQPSPGNIPYSDGQYVLQFTGVVNVGATPQGVADVGGTVLLATLILFINDNLATAPQGDTFGTQAWMFATLGEMSTTVPEPSTLLVFGAGIFGLGWHSYRRRQASKK